MTTPREKGCSSGAKIRDIRERFEGLGAELRQVEEELLELCDQEEPPPPPPPPDEPDIDVLKPGTAEVASWPVVQEPAFEPRVEDGVLTLVYGERLDPETWPGFVIGFMQEEGQPEELHHGNAWMVYPDGTAFPFEWLRRERERNETAKEVSYLLEHGQLNAGDLVWFFLAGPSRHLPNREQFRRRTTMRAFRWGSGKLTPA